MRNCDICDGPRVNGAVLAIGATGQWRISTGVTNPSAPDQRLCCRDCAKEMIGTPAGGE